MEFFEIMPLIETIGLIGIFCFVFAESGLFFGFFLPGDSLLFAAGVLAAGGYFDISLLFFGSFICAILGDSFGYYFGKKIGPKIFYKPNSFFFNKKNLDKTVKFFERYGNKTITLARFVPIVPTFAPIMAGVGQMRYRSFVFWNILGGLFWTSSMIFSGYFLGGLIKNIDRWILPIIFLIIVLSFVPILFQFIFKNKKENIGIENNSDKN